MAGRPQTKTCWRNLCVAAPVRVRLLGQDLDATAQALRGDEEPAQVERGLRADAGRFPGTAAKAGVGGHPAAGDEALREAVKRAVVVRITPPEAALGPARAATQVPGRGLAATVRRHPLGAYFLLAFACSWGYRIPMASATRGTEGLVAGMVSVVVIGWAVAVLHAQGRRHSPASSRGGPRS